MEVFWHDFVFFFIKKRSKIFIFKGWKGQNPSKTFLQEKDLHAIRSIDFNPNNNNMCKY